MPVTRSERIAKTVEFFPHNCAAPQASARDNALYAAQSLADALKGHQAHDPYDALGDLQLQAIQKLSDIFSELAQKKTKNAPPPEQTSAPPRVPQTPQLTRTNNKHYTPPNTVKPPRMPPIDGPHLIPLDNDDKTPRYNLRSRVNSTYPTTKIPHNYMQTMYFCSTAIPKCTQKLQSHAIINKITGDVEQYPALSQGPDANIWKKAYTNNLDWLAQGKMGQVDATNTIFFIPHNKIPPGRRVTYRKKECSIWPTKAKTHCVRLTVGGVFLDYPSDPSSTCASITTTTKILLNSTISTPGARFATANVSNFYYGTPMNRYKYMKIKFDKIPKEIFDAYNLSTLEHNRYVCMEIRKGMPGLKQAGQIASDRLVSHLAQYGYKPVRHTPSLWRHKTQPVTCTLVVNNLGIKYVGREYLDHLISTICDHYTVTVDESGTKYLGLTIEWNYSKGYVDIYMPGYVSKALHRFQKPLSKRPQHSPHAWQAPQYGQRVQYCKEDDVANPLALPAKQHVQQIVGTFLYYALALDFTMLVALGSIAQQTNNPIERTMSEIVWFLNYYAPHPDAKIRYKASDMHLWLSSDASCLSKKGSKSRLGAFFFLSDALAHPLNPPSTQTRPHTTHPNPTAPSTSMQK